MKLPGPGKLAALETIKASAAARAALKPGAGRIVIARTSKTATKPGKLTIRLRLNRRGRQALRQHHGRLRAKLTLRFKPTGGTSRTKSRTFTLKVSGL